MDLFIIVWDGFLTVSFVVDKGLKNTKIESKKNQKNVKKWGLNWA